MRQWPKLVILWIFLFASCTSAVSAFTVDKYVVHAPEPLTPGSPVTLFYNVEFPPAPDLTFRPENDLVMTTELENATWMYGLILEGVVNPGTTLASGQTLTLSGFELSYPGNVNETIYVTVSGNVPGIHAADSIRILDVCEIDNTGNITASTRVTKTVPVNTAGASRSAPAAVEPSRTTPARQIGLPDQVFGWFRGIFGKRS